MTPNESEKRCLIYLHAESILKEAVRDKRDNLMPKNELIGRLKRMLEWAENLSR